MTKKTDIVYNLSLYEYFKAQRYGILGKNNILLRSGINDISLKTFTPKINIDSNIINLLYHVERLRSQLPL